MKIGLLDDIDCSQKKIEYLKTSLIWTFIWGFSAHGFAYSNLLFNHDGVEVVSQYYGAQTLEIMIGRFIHPLYLFFRGTVNVPWLLGILSLCYISLSVYLLIDIFKLTKKSNIIILCGILATNTTITVLNGTYLFLCDLYAFAFLITSFSVWIIIKKQSIGAIILSSILLMIAIGIYQAFLSVWLVLVLIFSFTQNIENENMPINRNMTIKKSITNFFAIIVFASILYKICAHLFLKIHHLSFFQNFNYVEQAVDFKSVNVISLLFRTYKNFFIACLSLPQYYGTLHYSVSQFSKYIILFIYIDLFVILFLIFLKKRERINYNKIIYCLIILLLLPLAANCIYFLSKGSRAFYELVHYSNWVLYIFPILFIEENNVWLKKILKGAFIALIIMNIIIANSTYEKRKIIYDATSLTLNRMLTFVELQDDYVPGKTQIIFSGTLDNNPLYKNTLVGKLFPPQQKGRKISQTAEVAVTYLGTYHGFIRVCMNSNINFYPYTQEYFDLLNKYSQDIKTMPIFPAKGFCRMIDGIMFVKLSNDN